MEKILNRDSSAALTNQIFSIYDIFHAAFVEVHRRTYRPYSNILIPVTDIVEDLKNELLTLTDSIRSIMRMVIKMTETKELGEFIIKSEILTPETSGFTIIFRRLEFRFNEGKISLLFSYYL